MNIEHLKYLVAVADHQSISNASRHLHLKQQYLSSIVKNMETHFGVPLFDRHARGISLTQDGQYIIQKAREIIKQASEMEAPFLYPSQRKVSTVVDSINVYSVAQLNSHPLITTIELFNGLFPNVQVSLQNLPLEHIIAHMAQDTKTLALVTIFEPVESFCEKIPDSIMVLHTSPVSVSVLADAKNPIAQTYQSMSAADLLKQTLIAYTPYGTYQDTFLYKILSQYGTPNIKYTVNSSAMLISLLQKENLYTLGSHRIQLLEENLLTIPFKENFNTHFLLLIHKDALHSDMMHVFSDILVMQYENM